MLHECSTIDYTSTPCIQDRKQACATHCIALGCTKTLLRILYTTKFSLAKIFAKGSCFVLEQNFRQLHELTSRKLWVELRSCYAHMHVHSQLCQNFHCTKIHGKIFRQQLALAKSAKISPGENFHIDGT